MISATDVGQPSHWDSHHPGEGESPTPVPKTPLFTPVYYYYTPQKGFSHQKFCRNLNFSQPDKRESTFPLPMLTSATDTPWRNAPNKYCNTTQENSKGGDFWSKKIFALLTRRAQGNGLCVMQIFGRYSAFSLFPHDGLSYYTSCSCLYSLFCLFYAIKVCPSMNSLP